MLYHKRTVFCVFYILLNWLNVRGGVSRWLCGVLHLWQVRSGVRLHRLSYRLRPGCAGPSLLELGHRARRLRACTAQVLSRHCQVQEQRLLRIPRRNVRMGLFVSFILACNLFIQSIFNMLKKHMMASKNGITMVFVKVPATYGSHCRLMHFLSPSSP